MSPYKQATKDIQADLAKTGKCFLSFRKELNPIMDKIVRTAIKKQEEL